MTVPNGPQPVHIFPDCKLVVYETVDAIAGGALNVATTPKSATTPIDLITICLFNSYSLKANRHADFTNHQKYLEFVSEV